MANNNARFAFLGREFLTWLWFETERTGGTVDLPDGSPVRAEFGSRLSLQSGGAVAEDATVKAEAPALAEEARTALRMGKKPSKACMLIDFGERHFELTIDAATLALSAVKLPTLLGVDDDQAVLTERLALLQEIENVVHGLFAAFLTLRASEAWAETREALRKWVLSGEVESSEAPQ